MSSYCGFFRRLGFCRKLSLNRSYSKQDQKSRKKLHLACNRRVFDEVRIWEFPIRQLNFRRVRICQTQLSRTFGQSTYFPYRHRCEGRNEIYIRPDLIMSCNSELNSELQLVVNPPVSSTTSLELSSPVSTLVEGPSCELPIPRFLLLP
jgi:hypothetical protein